MDHYSVFCDGYTDGTPVLCTHYLGEFHTIEAATTFANTSWPWNISYNVTKVLPLREMTSWCSDVNAWQLHHLTSND